MPEARSRTGSGVITGRALKPIATSAGTIRVPERDFHGMTWRDVLALAQAAARRRDGLFTIVSSSEGAGGFTLTITTNAGVVTVGPYPFLAESVRTAIDYQNREGRTLDGL